MRTHVQHTRSNRVNSWFRSKLSVGLRCEFSVIARGAQLGSTSSGLLCSTLHGNNYVADGDRGTWALWVIELRGTAAYIAAGVPLRRRVHRRRGHVYETGSLDGNYLTVLRRLERVVRVGADEPSFHE